VDFYKKLTWAWNMPWREDQAKVISSFFDKKYSEVVIQAIFGGGKTTMMLAIIHMLVLHDPTLFFSSTLHKTTASTWQLLRPHVDLVDTKDIHTETLVLGLSRNERIYQ
jgi:hypothetical protein